MGWDEKGEGGQRGREEDRMERAEHTWPRVKRDMPYQTRARTRTTRAQLARPASSPGVKLPLLKYRIMAKKA